MSGSRTNSGGGERPKTKRKVTRDRLFNCLRTQGPPLRRSEVARIFYDDGPSGGLQQDHLHGLMADRLVAGGLNGEAFGLPAGVIDEQCFGWGAGVGIVLAVAVSTARVRVGLVDANLCLLRGELEERPIPALDARPPQAARETQLDQMIDAVSDAIGALWAREAEYVTALSGGKGPEAVAVALPLAVDHVEGIVTDDFASGYSVIEQLLDAWPAGVPEPGRRDVLWDTDVAASATGYMRCVDGFDHRNVLAVKASGTIRHAYFSDARLVRGQRHRANDFGHVRVLAADAEGLPGCPECGTDEPHLDGSASLAGIRHNVLRDESSIDDRAWADAFFAAAKADGDERDALARSALLLGQAIADARRLVDPAALLLTGYLVRKGGTEYVRAVKTAAGLPRSYPVEWRPPYRPAVRPSFTIAGLAHTAFEEKVFRAERREVLLSRFQDAAGRRRAATHRRKRKEAAGG